MLRYVRGIQATFEKKKMLYMYSKSTSDIENVTKI